MATTSSNEWRRVAQEGNSKTFIISTNAKKLGLFNLQDASRITTPSAVADKEPHRWPVQQGQVRLEDPIRRQDAPSRRRRHNADLLPAGRYTRSINDACYANNYAKSSSLTKMPTSGGTLSGKLSFENNGRIDCNNGNSVLHGRGCFELRASAERPIIFSSGSGRKNRFHFGNDGSDDNKLENAYRTSWGEARFKQCLFQWQIT